MALVDQFMAKSGSKFLSFGITKMVSRSQKTKVFGGTVFWIHFHKPFDVPNCLEIPPCRNHNPLMLFGLNGSRVPINVHNHKWHQGGLGIGYDSFWVTRQVIFQRQPTAIILTFCGASESSRSCVRRAANAVLANGHREIFFPVGLDRANGIVPWKRWIPSKVYLWNIF